jgi:hypothetical protein
MQIELSCPSCFCRFAAPADTAGEEIVDRMFGGGLCYALGDGETFEDMIFSTLTERGDIHCPKCGDAVQVSEESLGQLALSMLTWM